MNRKKIGILTFHRAHNYGAVLQCYALQEFLRSMGYDAFVIDYNNHDLWEMYDWFKLYDVCFCFQKWNKIPNRIVKLLLKWYKTIPRFYKFKRFQERQLHLAPTKDIQAKPFDVILIGSDQVWNLDITHGFDEYYWGQFTHPSKTKIATYGASLKKYWKAEETAEAISNIKNLYAVSTREQELASYLQTLDESINPIVVSDPVFLLSKEVWSKIAKKPNIHQPYVLFYQAMDNESVYNVAVEIARKENKKLIVLSANINGRNSSISRSASPADFIGWIKYADLVVTSSFHATAFSIIFQKPFYCVNLQMGHDSRLLDVLKTFDLSDRWINTAEDCNKLKIFEPQKYLMDMQNAATNYINNILG